MALYGGLHAYVGFFDLLKFYAKSASSNMKIYTQSLCDLFNLFKNIFESKATSIVYIYLYSNKQITWICSGLWVISLLKLKWLDLPNS